MDVTHPLFDQTYFICGVLHPSKSLELNGELFEEGKRRLYDFLEQDVVEGLCSINIPHSEEETLNPTNTSQRSSNGDIQICNFIF